MFLCLHWLLSVGREKTINFYTRTIHIRIVVETRLIIINWSISPPDGHWDGVAREIPGRDEYQDENEDLKLKLEV